MLIYINIYKKVNGMISGIWHELLDLQISLVHNVLDRPPIMFCHTELKYLLFPSYWLRQHLDRKKKNVNNGMHLTYI